jgi:hypothetical protein
MERTIEQLDSMKVDNYRSMLDTIGLFACYTLSMLGKFLAGELT